MFFHQLITTLLFILFILQITSNDRSYLVMPDEMEKPFKQYLTFSFSGNLIPGTLLEKVEKPKISIIIPMYNEEKNALKVIRTIQNQKLQEIEIVCVNDHSNDNTLKILEKLKKEDPRIKIITNKKIEVLFIIEFMEQLKVKENMLLLLMRMMDYVMEKFY